MKRVWLIAVLAAGVGAGPVGAQPPIPGGVGGAGNIQRPAFSPYLNLLRSGSAALNYYGLVRPEQQFRQSIGTLQGSVAANQQAIGGIQAEVEGGIPATGHPTQFLNYSGYFLSGGAAGGGATRPGGAGGFTAGGFMAGQRPGGVTAGQRPGGANAGGVGIGGSGSGVRGGSGGVPRR